MCENADEMSWVRVLSSANSSNDNPSDDTPCNAEGDAENSRPPADTITLTEDIGTGVTAVTAAATVVVVIDEADDSQWMPAQVEQTHAALSGTIDDQEMLAPERLTELTQEEQAGDFMDYANNKFNETVPEVLGTAEDTSYKATTGKAETDMQDIDMHDIDMQDVGMQDIDTHDAGKTTNHVTEPTFGQAPEMASVTAAPVKPAATSRKTNSSLRQSGSSIVTTVLQNPLPAALMGLGLSWMLTNMYQSRKRSSDYDASSDGYYLDQSTSAMKNSSSQLVESSTYSAQDNSNKAARTRDTASRIVGQAQDQVSDIADRTRDGVSDIADRTRDGVINLTNRVEQGVRRARHQYQQSLQENPLVVGAAALAVGSALGLALPSTQAENKLMGKAHENLMQKANEATQGTLHKVREVAAEAKRAAQKEAEYQGLTE